jgi:hypothetical protein
MATSLRVCSKGVDFETIELQARMDQSRLDGSFCAIIVMA